jgi:hypothetical protein
VELQTENRSQYILRTTHVARDKTGPSNFLEKIGEDKVGDESGQLHAPAALPPGKETQYPLDRRLSGPQSQSGRCGKERNLFPAGN